MLPESWPPEDGVKIFVGPEEENFIVSRALLCHHSPYFQRALNGRFREAIENSVHLDQDSPQIFAFLAEWMQKGTLKIFENKCFGVDDLQTALRDTCRILCELYCLSDKLQVDDIHDYVFAQLDRACRSAGDKLPLDQSTVLHVFQNTHEKAALRAYVVKELGRNLVLATGRHVKEYRDCFEGSSAVPGFAMLVIESMQAFKREELR